MTKTSTCSPTIGERTEEAQARLPAGRRGAIPDPRHVLQLCRVADELGIPVLCYGLRTDFRGELFPGSAALLALADSLIELKAVCECGRKATMNLRVDAEGRAVAAGAQTEIGGNDRYIALCRRHFFERLNESEARQLRSTFRAADAGSVRHHRRRLRGRGRRGRAGIATSARYSADAAASCISPAAPTIAAGSPLRSARNTAPPPVASANRTNPDKWCGRNGSIALCQLSPRPVRAAKLPTGPNTVSAILVMR